MALSCASMRVSDGVLPKESCIHVHRAAGGQAVVQPRMVVIVGEVLAKLLVRFQHESSRLLRQKGKGAAVSRLEVALCENKKEYFRLDTRKGQM